MGLKIFGIAATQSPDQKGESIRIDGVNLAIAQNVIDEHIPGNSTTVGAITRTKKIMSEKDAETPREKQAWEAVKAPLVYFEAELADDEGHPDAVSAAALIKFANARPELPFKIGASIEGLTLKRKSQDKTSEDYKIITSSIMEGVAITCRPCNRECLVWPWNTLEKTDSNVFLTQEAIDKILFAPMQDSISKRTNDMTVLRQEAARMLKSLKKLLELAPEKLRKSLDDWDKGGMCTLKCAKCGEAERLFKSSKHFRNRCQNCGHPFTMSDFWSAMNE